MASIGAKVATAASNAARSLGHSLDKMGASMEVAKYTERLVPSTRIVAVDGIAPTINETAAFIAPSANLVGDVTIGPQSAIWYGATLRGDGNKITIGSNTHIGDRALVHIAKIQSENATVIGNYVSVGPGAIVHAATVKDYAQVGANAQILDGATVGSHSILAPGSVLTQGTTVGDGEFWNGSPAKKIRNVTKEELEEQTLASSEANLELALLHAGECAKDYETIREDEERMADEEERHPDYWQPSDEKDGAEDVLGQGMPGRIFNTTLTNPESDLTPLDVLELEKKKKKQGL